MTNPNGRFGIHGGQYIPETLMNAVKELEEAYNYYKNDPEFNRDLTELLNDYAGRPSRLYYAEKMTKDLGGAKIYLKREDLNHTGAHKINNVLGQALLAKKMGKTRLIAETGAGQHGVATATAAALMGMECVVFMGEEDTKRQALNVYRMRLLGAEVIPVTSGTATLKDAVSEAMREWTKRISDTHYCLGSVMGPHPFPTIVRDFQAVISKEIKEQMLEKEYRLPDAVIACVGGGSNAIGSFYNFIEDEGVELIGCEAAGRGIDTFETAATVNTGRLGIFHGMKSYFCQDKYGQIAPVYSISAGLDYPGVGPEHAYLHDIGRAQYVPVTDDEAVKEASVQEIIRRFMIAKCDYKKGKITEEALERSELLMKEVGAKEEDRKVVAPARDYAEYKRRCDKKYVNVVVMAIEMPDGSMITGRSSRRMVAAAAAVLNAVKKLAGIDDDKYVIAPNVFKDIQDLKANVLNHDRTSLNVEEILTALSISAEINACADKAVQMLGMLKGCKAHCTAILSDRDEQTLRSMGIDVTCDPEYVTTNLYFA